jgi:hypothetical protein
MRKAAHSAKTRSAARRIHVTKRAAACNGDDALGLHVDGADVHAIVCDVQSCAGGVHGERLGGDEHGGAADAICKAARSAARAAAADE